MLKLNEIKKNLDLVNEIEWDMTPEEAVILYLEWGNNWAHGRVIKSKNDMSHYFVVNNWGKNPVIYLIRRNSDEAVELGKFEMPYDVKEKFLKSVSYNKGLYSIDGVVKDWLQKNIL
jgi:hypothetical protein